ncbi:MAG: hypothetical protein FWF59_02575 [Turicibacter sp.]|nr:hypothetical protein [Turicibacter sp.]
MRVQTFEGKDLQAIEEAVNDWLRWGSKTIISTIIYHDGQNHCFVFTYQN